MTLAEKFPALTTRELTSGTYRGIGFEVAHPHGKTTFGDYHTTYGWCGYIYLRLDHFADETLRESLWPEPQSLGIGTRLYLRHPDWLDDLDFHGGVTYFGLCLDGEKRRYVKVGCDYRHYRDDDELYSERTVSVDLCRTIDQLHERTTYLMMCGGDGRLAHESEGFVPDGWDHWVSRSWVESEIVAGRWLNHHDRDGKKTTP